MEEEWVPRFYSNYPIKRTFYDTHSDIIHRHTKIVLRRNKLPLGLNHPNQALLGRRVHSSVYGNIVVYLNPTIHVHPNKSWDQLPWKYPEDHQQDHETDLLNDDPTSLSVPLVLLNTHELLVQLRDSIMFTLRQQFATKHTMWCKHARHVPRWSTCRQRPCPGSSVDLV